MTRTPQQVSTETDEQPATPSPSRNQSSLPKWTYYLLGVLVLAMIGMYGRRYWESQRPERRFERAMVAVGQQDFKTVERELAGMQDSPSYAPHRHLLQGLLYLHREQYRAAVLEFQHAEEEPSLRAPALALSGQALYQLGHWSEAEQKLTDALAVDPTADEAAMFLETLRKHRPPQQRFHDALAALRRGDMGVVQEELEVLRREPDYQPHCQFLNATLLLRANQPAAALDAFGLTIGDPRLKVPTLIYSGEALYRMGKLKDAKRLLQNALAISPAEIDAHRWLGAIYYDLGAMNDAVYHLTQVSQLDPEDPRPSRLMGLINKDYEHYEDAVKHYREALDRGLSDTDTQDVRLELAQSLVKLRRYEEAVDALVGLPKTAEVLTIEAESEFNQGNVEKAVARLDDALKADPDYVEALRLRGAVAMEQNNAETAVEVLRRACELEPKDYFARFRLAQAYQKLGQTSQAEAEMKTADRLKEMRLEFAKLHETATQEPNNADLRYRIGALAIELDYAHLAPGWFRAALALDPNHAEAAEALRKLADQAAAEGDTPREAGELPAPSEGGPEPSRESP